jgi:hypothetical protein
MPNPPTLYLHCGLHKTGTTSLQAALSASHARLREAGLLYPLAGRFPLRDRPGGGPGKPHHHNLVFQLARSRRFDHRHGDLGDLASEIATFDGDVVLSSEIFEWFLADPPALAPIEQLARMTGRRFVIVIYLRNQIDYCESLFHEMLKHGAGREYRQHADAIAQAGQSAFRDWVNQFDYERMLDGLAGSGLCELTVRNVHSLAGGSIFADFAAAIGFDGDIQPSPGEENSNQRLTPIRALGQFYRNRSTPRMTAVQRARLRHLTERVANPVTGSALQQRFIERFAEGNRRVCAQWGLVPLGLDMADRPRPETAPTFEQFFSFETQCLIASGRLPTGIGRADPPRWTPSMDAAALEFRLKERLADQYWLISRFFGTLGRAQANTHGIGR